MADAVDNSGGAAANPSGIEGVTAAGGARDVGVHIQNGSEADDAAKASEVAKGADLYARYAAIPEDCLPTTCFVRLERDGIAVEGPFGWPTGAFDMMALVSSLATKVQERRAAQPELIATDGKAAPANPLPPLQEPIEPSIANVLVRWGDGHWFPAVERNDHFYLAASGVGIDNMVTESRAASSEEIEAVVRDLLARKQITDGGQLMVPDGALDVTPPITAITAVTHIAHGVTDPRGEYAGRIVHYRRTESGHRLPLPEEGRTGDRCLACGQPEWWCLDSPKNVCVPKVQDGETDQPGA